MGRASKEQIAIGIVDAAVECVLAFGVGNVQITQIAARAGVSTRTLHRYYPEKEALLSDAAAKYLSDSYAVFARNYEAADKTGLTGLERLLLFLRLQKKYYQTDAIQAMMTVDLRMYHVRHGHEQANSWALRGGRQIRDIVIGNIEAGKLDGSIRQDIPMARISPLIAASFNGVMQRLTFIHRSDEPEAYKTEMLAIFDDYIAMLAAYLRS